MPENITGNLPPTGNRGGLIARLARLDDGRLMKAIFIALLTGTIGILALDYFQLSNQTETPAYNPTINPILPPMERTEGDPDSPAFAPQTHLTSTPEELGEPMHISLEAGGLLRLEGTIGIGTSAALAHELEARGEYVKTIRLNSPGGIVDEAMEMGRLIRAGEYATEVDAGALCASSCPLVFAGGSKRLAHTDAAIGVHQIYAGAAQNGLSDIGSAAAAMTEAQSKTAIISRYLDEMQVDPALWLHALETPPRQLYYFTSDELSDYELATKIIE